MPVYTFSTKTKKPDDTKLVEEIKEYCDKKGLTFSVLVVEALKEKYADVVTK